MDLHVCRHFGECSAAASSARMQRRISQLTEAQRRSIRLLIELAKRAGLCWDKHGRRDVRAMGMKGVMLGEISLVAFMNQPGGAQQASALPADVMRRLHYLRLQGLRHVPLAAYHLQGRLPQG